MSIPFYKTGYGKKFFEKQLPDLIKAINKLANELKIMNEKSEKTSDDNIAESSN